MKALLNIRLWFLEDPFKVFFLMYMKSSRLEALGFYLFFFFTVHFLMGSSLNSQATKSSNIFMNIRINIANI